MIFKDANLPIQIKVPYETLLPGKYCLIELPKGITGWDLFERFCED
jgi:hypothetical protein